MKYDFRWTVDWLHHFRIQLILEIKNQEFRVCPKNNPTLLFIMKRLFSFIESLHNILIVKILYWVARVGMGLTFITSGIRKLPGVEFTLLPTSDPVGAYFNAMHETGFYWNFIGYFQILIGLLVFFNRFVVMSVLLMMPVTVNIFLVSVSLGMRGTPLITAAMVLGNTFLILWHYKHYLGLLENPVKLK